MLLYDYGGYGVVEAPNSVKVVVRDRYPLVTPRLRLVSSAVRAAPLQGDGRQFNPVTRHQFSA